MKNVGNARAHLANREGVDETRGADNVDRIAGYTQADRVAWHVFVGTPADAALSAARTNFVEMLLYGTMSLLLGALLAARLGVRIARPLRMLAYDAMLLARGNLAHRTKVAGDDETGVLAATLNRMAQMIEDRTQALHDKTAALELKTQALTRSTTELSTITANVPVLIAYVDASETFRFVNEYVHDVFGVTPADIVGRTLRDMLGAKVHARLDERMRDVLAGLPQTFETSFAPEAPTPLFLVTCFPDYGDADAVLGAYVVCQDITRRKEAENALEARERFIRLIADAVPARITYSDTSERLRFGNRRFAEYWETDPQAIVGRRVADVVSPAAYAQIGPELVRSYRGETRRFDLVVDRADGTQYYQVDHVPDVDAHGNVHGIVTISQDVTALRQAKQALTASERRMRMIADNLPALIVYLSADERYLFVNARSQQMFGLEPEQIVGRRIVDLLTPEAYAQTAPHIADVLKGNRARFQRTLTRAGRSWSELVELIPDQDARGNVVGFYGLVQDVTDLRDAHAKAEASEQRLRSITDNIPSMIAYIDRGRHYRFNSRYYESWVGRPLAEITGRHLRDVMGVDAYAEVRPNLDRAFGGERVDFDVEVRQPAGESRFVRGTYIPDFDAAGRGDRRLLVIDRRDAAQESRAAARAARAVRYADRAAEPAYVQRRDRDGARSLAADRHAGGAAVPGYRRVQADQRHARPWRRRRRAARIRAAADGRRAADGSRRAPCRRRVRHHPRRHPHARGVPVRRAEDHRGDARRIPRGRRRRHGDNEHRHRARTRHDVDARFAAEARGQRTVRGEGTGPRHVRNRDLIVGDQVSGIGSHQVSVHCSHSGTLLLIPDTRYLIPALMPDTRSLMPDSPVARDAVRSLGASKIREIANAGMHDPDVLPFWFGEPDEVTPQFIRDAAVDIARARRDVLFAEFRHSRVARRDRALRHAAARPHVRRARSPSPRRACRR